MNFYDRLKELEIVYFKDCFKLCGGHCCNANKCENVVLPMLKSEYLYIKDKSSLRLVGELKYQLNEKKSLEICFLECALKGLCKIRPLVCKLYPFFAITNDLAEFKGFKEISLNDLFYKDKNNHPCPLIRDNFDELQKQFSQNVKKILDEPIVIFIFRLLELVYKQLLEYFQSILGDFCLDEVENKKEFFLSLNFQNAFKSKDFQVKINEIYNNLSVIYKDRLDRYLSDT